MGATDKARLEAELVGASQVATEAGKIESAVSKAGKAGESAFKSFGGAVSGALGNLVSDGLKAAGVIQTLSLANAVEETKRLDLATAKLGQSAGIAGSTLRASFDAAERKTLTSANAQAEFARALGKITYDGRFAAESVGALGDEALAVGRDLGDELPLAAALKDLGVQSGDIRGELGRLRRIADEVDTVGGHVALADALAQLQPQLQSITVGSDEARAKLEALVAVLGKGLKPQQAAGVASSALSLVKSRALDIERLTGRRVIGEDGQVDAAAVPQALADIQKIGRRKFGRNTEAARRAFISEFGPELGSALVRTDFSQVNTLAAGARGWASWTSASKTAQEAEAFRQSKEGQRIAGQLAKGQAERAVGDQLLGIHDRLVDTLGVKGSIAAEFGAGYLTNPLLKGVGTLARGSGLTLGTAGAIAGVTASFAAPALGVLADIGEDTDTTGRRYRSEHASLLGTELANAAIQRGDLNPVIGRAQGDPEVIGAALEKLASTLDQLPANLAAQVQAGLQASKITVKAVTPLDPNAPRGN